MDYGMNCRALALGMAALLWTTGAMAAAPNEDSHPARTPYNGKVLVEHADFVPFGVDVFAGYLTIWNGTNSEKVIRSIDVKPLGKAELTKRVSTDVVRAISDTSVVTVPPKSELHMDVETIFLLVKGSMAAERPKVIVRFEDGSSSSANGRFVSDRRFLTDHHHPSR